VIRRQLNKLFVIMLASGIVLAACAPATSVPETSAPPEVQVTQAEVQPTEVQATQAEVQPTEAVMVPLDPSEKVQSVVVLAPSAGYDVRRWEATLLMTTAWKDLGFDVDLQGFADFGTLTDKYSVEPFDWDAYVSGYVGRPSRLDPDELLYRPWHSSGIGEGGANASAYINPEYDQVVEAQRTALDQEKRREYVYQAQEILAQDIPEITLLHRREVHAYNQADFDNWTPMIGRGVWNVWNLLGVEPKTDKRVLTVAWATDIPTTNPLALDNAIESLQLTYDTLARIGTDGVPIPWAAESWNVVDDTTVDVTIRDGMNFHDGEPVTAEDVKFSFDFIKEYGTAPFFASALSPIQSVDLVDERNLRFHLVEPFAPLFFNTFTYIYILPKHIWENVTEREGVESPDLWENPQPVGSGPFQLMYHRRGEEIYLEAYKDHFSPPKIDGIRIVHYANVDAIFGAMVTGAADMSDVSITALQIPEAEAAPNLGVADVRDFGVFYMAFNFRRPPFNDLAVRQAIAHTLDHQTVVQAVLGGYGEPGQGMIAPAIEYWHNPKWEEWLNTDYKFDTRLARQMLADAGYRWDESGKLYYPEGGPPIPEK
jgi:peptide/nickel transport system substrate-binding protein